MFLFLMTIIFISWLLGFFYGYWVGRRQMFHDAVKVLHEEFDS